MVGLFPFSLLGSILVLLLLLSLVGFLKTWPIHLNLYFLNYVLKSAVFMYFCGFLLVIFYGWNILKIVLMQPFWKLVSLFISLVYIILQHSALYIRTNNTQILYILIFVRLLVLFNFHKFLSLKGIPWLYPIILLWPCQHRSLASLHFQGTCMLNVMFISHIFHLAAFWWGFLYRDITSGFFILMFWQILLTFLD